MSRFRFPHQKLDAYRVAVEMADQVQALFLESAHTQGLAALFYDS